MIGSIMESELGGAFSSKASPKWGNSKTERNRRARARINQSKEGNPEWQLIIELKE